MQPKVITAHNSKVTITDIAESSGVSPATVSLVLRDKPGISSETRQRVLDVAQTLGYLVKVTPKAMASELTSIGLIIKTRPDNSLLTNNFYGPVLAGIESVCRQRQINLLYATLPVDEHNTPLEMPRLLVGGETNGILLVGTLLNEAMDAMFQQQNLPVVLVDAYATHDIYDATITNNTLGAVQAVNHLIENGHQHIAIVGSQEQGYPSIQERRQGYLQAINKHGFRPYFADCFLSPDEAVTTTMQLLNQNPQISAIFGCNDEVAIAAMQAARELGYQVPQDLSVVGFDNIALAQHVSPALTTMRVDKMGMGRLAAQLLINRIEYPEAGQIKSVIQPYLIKRQSVMSVS